tara:strand:+ start:885 stop:1415 length:531 start_codon:yes stop_codon:yes gene_type:complete
VYNKTITTNQENKMTNQTPRVYDRVYLDVPGKTLVIEMLCGYDGPIGNEGYVDAWRLIDLATGEVFVQETNLYDVIGKASLMTSDAKNDVQSRGGFHYVDGRPPVSTYRLFKDLPIVDRMKLIAEHAQDLEHDFRVLNDDRDPIAVAAKELNDMYNEKPCFYVNIQTEEWMLDPEV